MSPCELKQLRRVQGNPARACCRVEAILALRLIIAARRGILG
eukprot:CAMPEP_0180665966 /NCGR_PEP_ID=MMETSP1037_2-20121125/61564_1 /TAXON_ID=632150 /ORGANISM="Azadinium spinosum, Strain 3D9" /LENGTH=41 /DNA_ID= /DNA_START= /DNA_END= /DNA_ORIENTATION=